MFPYPARRAFEVRGKVVLITGAGSGIGSAVAENLRARGASVALLDIDAEAVDALADRLGTQQTLPLEVDVRDRTAMTAAITKTVSHFGHLDVVVANAGIAPPAATVRTIDAAEFDRVIDINLTGVFNTVRPALEHVIDAHGHVVVVSSAAAFAPGAAGSPYMMSKAAVEQLGRALRIELAAHGASAGVAYFGFVETPMVRKADTDPLLTSLMHLAPWPLSQRISPDHAGGVIADAIARRAPETFAPAPWRSYSLLRGLINAVADTYSASSPKMHALLGEVEALARSSNS